MRKFHLLGLALFAMLAFGAVVASEAFALETVWLEGGTKPMEALLVDSEGELLLEDTEALGKADILCSGLNEGVIGGDASGPNPKWDEVTRITGLNTLTEPLWIVCKFEAGKQGACESEAASPPEAMAVNLPWLTELTLNGTQVLDIILGSTAGNAGWVARCLVLMINTEDTCTAENAAAEIDNTTEGDVLALFSDAISPELALCSASNNKKSGIVDGPVLILAVSGEALAWSEA